VANWSGEGQGLTNAGLRLLGNATEDGSLGSLAILGSGLGIDT